MKVDYYNNEVMAKKVKQNLKLTHYRNFRVNAIIQTNQTSRITADKCDEKTA